jgi:hypothetical protein
MIMLNESFNFILAGRKINGNIKKPIYNALTSQVGQMLYVAFIIFRIPSP